MTPFNKGQVIAIGALLVAWGLTVLGGKSVPPAAALAVGWLIAWVCLIFLPKIL